MQMDGASGNHSGVIDAMTVGTTVTRGAARTHPAAKISLPVRTGDVSLGSMSVMRTMTVEMGRMSRSTYVTPQNPHAPLISSGVTMGTALRWVKSVTMWMTAQTTVTRKAVALMSARILQSVIVTTTVQIP